MFSSRQNIDAAIIKRRGEIPKDIGDTSRSLLKWIHKLRGVSYKDRDLSFESLYSYESLLGIERAVDILSACIYSGKPILIVGDYDADGATGSALAVRALRACGAEKITYLVPSRFTSGYGLSSSIVDIAYDSGFDLIVTVDNGIASLEAIQHANELMLPVIVTDHHLPGEALPTAAAIVNPRQPGDKFPSKTLAGVGVIFYLCLALKDRLRYEGWFGVERPEPDLTELLDLVALGTVADVVSLDRNNRILVEQGLRRIRAGQCSPGVWGLLMNGRCDLTSVTTQELGFLAGPRLNAAGRLSDMSIGVESLLANDIDSAKYWVIQLAKLNQERKEIEGEMKDEAETIIQAILSDTDEIPQVLCLFDPNWHHGVLGILASRIRDAYYRPTFIFSAAEDGSLRGSARSIDCLHIRDLLVDIDRRRPGLISAFGGHAMAAGLSLPEDSFELFHKILQTEIHRKIDDSLFAREIFSDGELPGKYMNLDTARFLRFSGPWGKDFPEPLFDGIFTVEHRVSEDRNLKLRVRSENESIDAIGFGWGQVPVKTGDSIRLAYYLDVNRVGTDVQLRIEHLIHAN